MAVILEADTFDIKGLEQIIKALKLAGKPKAQVGIFSSDNARKDSGSNATIGAVHEFGAPDKNIPQRSFLRVPIADHLQEKLNSAELTTDEKIKEVIKSGSVVPWLQEIAVAGEAVAIEAFHTGGYGQWPAWKDLNYTNNANQLLVDTTQLRESIHSRVDE